MWLTFAVVIVGGIGAVEVTMSWGIPSSDICMSWRSRSSQLYRLTEIVVGDGWGHVSCAEKSFNVFLNILRDKKN